MQIVAGFVLEIVSGCWEAVIKVAHARYGFWTAALVFLAPLALIGGLDALILIR